MGREPETDMDWELCELDRMVTIDEFHRDAESSSRSAMLHLRQVETWGKKWGVPTMLAKSMDELKGMPKDHRPFAWMIVDKARSVKYETVKRLKGSVFNFYRLIPGMKEEDIPTSTRMFMHRMDGLAQRLGVTSEQKRTFTGVLLKQLVRDLATGYAKARGEERVQWALANAAFHLYCQGGLRANEGFHCTKGDVADSIVVGVEALRKDVRPYLLVGCSIQTKEERFEPTCVPVAFYTHGECPLSTGTWVVQALRELAQVGRGPVQDPDGLVFSTARGKRWSMAGFWKTYVLGLLTRYKEQGLGGLDPDDDLSEFGTNSFRRTWNSMAAKRPNHVDEAGRDEHARWRKKLQKRQRVNLGMNQVYNAMDIEEKTRATFFLTLLK
jgi:hypothetical protein